MIYFLSLEEEDRFIIVEDDKLKSISFLIDKFCDKKERTDRIIELREIVHLCQYYQSILTQNEYSDFRFNKKFDIVRELHQILIHYVKEKKIKNVNQNLIDSTNLFNKVTEKMSVLYADDIVIESIEKYI